MSAGEIGGLFAGAVALLATIGHGVKWLMGFTSVQQARRAAEQRDRQMELDAREQRLESAEAAYREQIEERLELVEKRQGVILALCHQLAAGLRTSDPRNRALRLYDEMLRTAFKVDPSTPPEMISTLHEIDRSAAAAGEGR